MTGGVLESDDEDEEDEDEGAPDRKRDEREKGGGRRKRRTAYPSGRREKMGVPQGGFSNNRSKVNRSAGGGDRENKKRSISKSDASYSGKWRKW